MADPLSNPFLRALQDDGAPPTFRDPSTLFGIFSSAPTKAEYAAHQVDRALRRADAVSDSAYNAERAEQEAYATVLQVVNDVRANNPNMPPHVVRAAVLKDARFLKNALRVPADKMTKFVSDLSSMITGPGPDAPIKLGSGDALYERVQPHATEMDPNPQLGYREVAANRPQLQAAPQVSDVTPEQRTALDATWQSGKPDVWAKEYTAAVATNTQTRTHAANIERAGKLLLGDPSSENSEAQQGDIARAVAILDSEGQAAAGAGSVLARIPGTKAKQLDGLISTIKSSVALDRLVSLKAAGGTLGAVSEAELKLLEGSLGALDVTQHPDVLKANLNRVGSIYGRIVQAAQGDVSRIGGSAGAGGNTGTMGFNQPINMPKPRRLRFNPQTGNYVAVR